MRTEWAEGAGDSGEPWGGVVSCGNLGERSGGCEARCRRPGIPGLD